MFKKILPFLCSLAPLYAFGAATPVDIPTNPTEINLGTGYYANITSGTGINVGTDGINIYNLSVLNTDEPRSPDSSNGDLYIVKPAGDETGVFGIVSGGDINITNNLLIAATRGLSLSGTPGGAIDLTVDGDITANGALTIKDIADFESGAILSGDTLTINAGTITTGMINSSNGDTNVVASGALDIGGIIAGAGASTTKIGGSSITSGDVQNLAGAMTVTTTGDFTSSGSVENSGASLTISGGNGTKSGDVNISGTLKNDVSSGVLTVLANSLTVSGSDTTHNASFVNSGVATFDVTGATSFLHGMNLANMSNASGSELNITTGTLSLGSGTIIANDDATVNITVNSGVLGASNIAISNGDTNINNTRNSARMTLSGLGVSAASVYNNGASLAINTVSSTADDDITIAGGVTGMYGTKTTIFAGDALTVGGIVSNSGDMTLYGQNVELASVSNSGSDAVLNISAPTDAGSLVVTGNVTNTDNAKTTITSKGVELLGTVTNNSGLLKIVGSDASGSAVTIGSVVVNNGEMDLNAWVGGVNTGSVTVNNGILKLGNSVRNFVSSGDISVDGDIVLMDASAITSGSGDVYLTASGNPGVVFKSTGGSLTVGGDIIATDNTVARTATFDVVDGSEIRVSGTNGVDAQNKGKLIFGSNASSILTIENGALNASNNGKVEIYSGDTTAKSLNESANGEFIMHGNSFIATNGAINISNGVWFGGASQPSVGMVIAKGDGAQQSFTLTNSTSGQDITILGGVSVGDDKVLNLVSADDVNITGATNIAGTLDVGTANLAKFNNPVIVGGESDTTALLDVSAKTIELAGITNYATTKLDATATTGGTIRSSAAIINKGTFTAKATDDITFGDFTSNKGGVTITSTGGDVQTGGLSVSAGTAAVSGNSVAMNSLSLTGGTTTISSGDVDVTGAVSVSGNVVQGASGGMLNLAGVSTFDADSLTIVNSTGSNYGFTAKNGTNATYTIANAAIFGKSITVASNATANITAGSIIPYEVDDSVIIKADVNNSGTLSLTTTDGVSDLALGGITNNSSLTINTSGLLSASAFNNNGKATITSNDMTVSGAFESAGVLYQNYSGTLLSGDVNITNTNYTINASSVDVAGISQINSVMTINTDSLTVDENISANDLTIAAAPAGDWLNATVGGDISGGVKIFGLEHMRVDDNYTFDNNSMLHAAVLPFGTGIAPNTTTYNYWADVSLADDNTLGQIRNHSNDPANALIYVGGKFISDVDMGNLGVALDGGPLVAPQIGINLYNVVDQGSAVWLVYADQGLQDLNTKIRNLYVNFCNADGSRCFNYFNAFDNYNPASDRITNDDNNGTEDNLPIYLTVRDYDNDGTNDSLYIVFDPRFGGPVTVFDIEPIVARVDDSTDGEVQSANGLDKMIAGQLEDAGFYNDTPIEAIPVAFDGTNLSELANELYNRMEQYVVNRDGTPLARFSRLVQPRELEQVAGSIALNEHTSFRDFEDHMLDEFIWNRNRNLNKLWFDADFGMFRQNASDDKTVDGNRFNLTAGFDWQESNTLILGLMGRISHMSSENSDSMDLGYMPGVSIAGHNNMSVADTDIGIGAYLMKTLGTKVRVYGNAFLDAHLFDISREQNYVDDISGSGTAFSLISEWGLLHDWLNQYIVGNLYARAGYNFGFSIKEKAAGDNYMNLQSDGYFIFTPGYSLIAQKRIYTSPWFQIRPYASIGIEYDVLGMPEELQYKFAPSKSYSDYDVEINPLWANIGAGVELLSAVGVQFGLDYRYQYNTDIQMHNIRLSGSYRF